MTRLDRVLKLLDDYDNLANLITDVICRSRLEKLRQEKEKLAQELIEHGCRRKN